MSARILALLFLLICASCSTNRQPSVVVKPEVIREKVPSVLLRPCPPKSRKPVVTTGDIVDRLTYTEGALATCAAQVAAISTWNSQ
jgi:hypothetical protein